MESLTERQKQLLAEHQERLRTAKPGKPLSRTFVQRMTSSMADPFTVEAPAPVEEEQPLIFRP